MALNIKSDEAHRLAKELAAARGGTLTDAVIEALGEALAADRERSASADVLVEEIAQIQELVAALPDLDARTPEEILGYDEHGVIR